MKSVRLPAHIKPLRYQLLIKPNLENFTFEGEESISFVIGKSTSAITLHSKELNIFDAEYQAASIKHEAKKTVYDKKAETATFVFRHKLPKGKGELKLKFKGVLNDNMRGFYRSRYIHKNKEKHLATTQFEATDARQAFPCFDEPAQKAIFDVTIMVPPGLTAISNTIETSVAEHTGGFKAVKFAPSPKMSTYLLAFIVGEFEFIEGQTKSGVTVRVFVTPGKKHQAKFALDCAIKSLEFYNNYFDIPYPLPILDLIAIPDFSHGAMENWGAITYRESALLVDPEHSSASNKQWVALVIAHELAHQWFGNLVTMHWWTDLWLNEGFASYIEYLAVDHIFPSWDIWTQFAYNDLGVALRLDALKSTHPIEVKVNHPDEIGEIFDEVSYSKGASVIRMLANFLGEKDFRDGLRYYLKKHAYKNTKTKDLWTALEKTSKKPVSQIMRNWTGKPGYPVIKVTDQPKTLKLVQSRFFSSNISRKESNDKTIWEIPLTLKSEHSKVKSLIKSKSQIVSKLSPHWIKFNQGESSLVKIDYPSQLLVKLYEPIKTKTLPALDRLGIIRDAFSLAESGDLPTSQVLELCNAYQNENDFTVWVEIISGLDTLDNLLDGKTCHKNFKIFSRKFLKNIVNKVGWRAKTRETHTMGFLRSLVIRTAGGFGDESVIRHAKELFDLWIAKNKSIDPDLRGAIYNVIAENGSHKEHRFIISKYKLENLHEEKNRLGRALGQFKDRQLIAKSLNFALSKYVRHQDTPGIFMSAWNNKQGKNVVWQMTKTKWKALLSRYPSSGHMLARFIKPASLLTTKNEAEGVRKFFRTHGAPGAKRSVEQVLEKIYSNHAWLTRDINKITAWLMKAK